MSDRESIVAELRTVVGKQVKQLRRQGKIPAIIYGKGATVNIQLDNVPLRRVLRSAGMNSLIDVTLDGGTHTVLAREIQQHVTRGDLIHIDFMEVDMKVMVSAEVQLTAVGTAAPEVEGLGAATLDMHSVDIECLPADLVDEIEVNLALIETPDDVIYVADLTAPEGVTITTDGEAVVARFAYVVEEEEEEEEDELYAPSADAVEVIKKGKEEDEEIEE